MVSKRRVVVTGIGLVTPLGCGELNVWDRILKGHTGVKTVEPFHKDIPISVAAKVEDFDMEALFGKQSCRYRSLATHYALHASDIALKNAGFNNGAGLDLCRAGVAVASGVGALQDICEGSKTYETAQRRLSPFFVPKILISSMAGEVSIRNGLKGPNHAVATACAASAHAIGDAFNFIRLGYADFMVAGGAEACLDPLTVAGFNKMRALTRSEDPASASSPFDEGRSGFVIGEGSGILVLETLESAKLRNAQVIAEIVGYGMSGDAHHITSPPEDGEGAGRAMISALRDAHIHADQVDYVNAHATSTPTGDRAELSAIHSVFQTPLHPSHSGIGGDLFVSSTKGATGHMLGAAGAVEASFACMALQSASLPPTLNLINPLSLSNHAPGDKCEGAVREVRHVARTAHYFTPQTEVGTDTSACRYAMSNSFGFGGTNVSLVFKKFRDGLA